MSDNVANEKRKLGLFDIFFLGYGGAIGSGIFVLTGLAIAATGRSISLVVLVGCAFMLLAYFYNVLLSSMFKFKGGDYSQKAVAFNPLFTGLAAYTTFVNGFGLAMYSVAIVTYLSAIVPGIVVYTKPIALAIIVLVFASTFRGTKFMSIINNVMIIVLMGAIALFIIMGIPNVKEGYWGGEGFFTSGFKGFIVAIALMGWACQGATMGPVSVSAVTKNAKRVIPFGILIGQLALAGTYFLMVYVASGVLPLEQVAGQNLSAVAREIFPYWVFVIFIVGGAAFAIATSMLVGVIMVRYPMQRVANDGWMPPVFKKTIADGYPWVTYLLYFAFCVIPVLVGFSLDVMVSMVMIPNMIMSVYLNLACIGIIRKYPEQWKKSILHMPAPIMYVICVLAAGCAGVVCYNLFGLFSRGELLLMLILLAVMFAATLFCLKIGSVKKEALQANRKAILEEAFQSESEE